MAVKHPYISSGGPLVQAVTQFRKSFPGTVDAFTLKKLGIAPNNESYLINILKFLGLIDENLSKSDKATKIFVIHKDEDFQAGFSKLVKEAYSDLFGLHNEDAWTLDDEGLITYFRQTDQSTEIVGKRQAITFKALAGIGGKRELSSPRASSPKKPAKPKAASAPQKKKTAATPKETSAVEGGNNQPSASQDMPFGLTVRVEINLPTDGSQATYDRIFKSIKENLIDAYKA